MAKQDSRANPGAAEPLVVAAFWALLTLSYAAHVLSRWALSGRAPGLSTLTAAGAVMAVWLYFPVHYRERLHRGAFRRTRVLLLVVLGAVVGGEWTALLRDLARHRAPDPIPAAAAFAFTFVFRHLLIDLLAAPRPPRGSGD